VIQLTRNVSLASPIRIEAGPMNHSSRVEINLARLDANLAAFRDLIHNEHRFIDRQTMICVAVKANAYGLGAVPIAKRLVARGVDMLAVYSPQQAEELVRHAVNCPILLLMPLRALSRSDALYRHAAAGLLHLSIHDAKQIAQVNQFGQMLGLKVPVHLYFDTGMSRSGLDREAMVDMLAALPELRHVRLTGIYTHFATADTDEGFLARQYEQLEMLLSDCAEMIGSEVMIHTANTFAALRNRAYHRDMVRIGLGVYGYGPDLLEGGSIMAETPTLEHTVRWISRVVQVARYPQDATVGYNATHRLRRDSVLGIVPVGYGDGYPVALSNKGITCLPQFRTGPVHAAAPVLGRVSMDQMVIDLTDVAATVEANHGRRIDDADPLSQLLHAEVELISDDPTSPCSLPALARAAGTSCYELLCRISPHVPRTYLTPNPERAQPIAQRRV